MSDRFIVAAAALAGCLGVAGSAAASHVTGGGSLEIAARFLLIHAAALVAVAAASRVGLIAPLGRWAAWLLLAGLALFCGDLALRALAGRGLFPMAAPTGGFALMGGWLLVALAALMARRSPS